MEKQLASLHDGNVVLYRREGSKKGTIHYRIKLPGRDAYERKTTGTSDIEEAKKAADARYREIHWRAQRGLSVTSPTLERIANHYIGELEWRKEEVKKSQKRIDIKISIIRRYMIPFFRDTPISDITPERMTAYHDWRAALLTGNHEAAAKLGPVIEVPANILRVKQSYTGNARALSITLINGLFQHALEMGQVNRAEIHFLPRYKTPQANRRGTMTAEQFRELVDYLDTRQKLVRGHKRYEYNRMALKCLVQFIAYTGMRTAEALAITWEDIRTIKHKGQTYHAITVRDGKTGPREVIALKEIKAVLDELKHHRKSKSQKARLFENYNDSSKNSYGYAVNQVLRDMSLKYDNMGRRISLYSLRHYFITQRLLAGVDIHLLARNCGNSVAQIDRTYSHVLPRMKLEELTK